MKKIWDYLEHFSHRENWGDPDKVSGLILLPVNAIRDYCGWEFFVHVAYDLSGHTIDSYHYKGLAIDGHFDPLIPFDIQIIKVEEALRDLQLDDYMGVGLYPTWENLRTHEPLPGFHFDARGFRARWGWIGEVKPGGKKQYCSYREAKLFAERM